ncbi:MAG TPA: 50S ribosomal protein L10 [Candidatus Paceibacterota bacterium]|nr:50S ribosomal protein L10 [Candidatus Paceibacterota bacterium]HMP19203.1 50S ribosomal protein L10 [Candidatus Paceibacterota bacterium]HMP85620.1 50S ribosomal protein L10 [Candidatus Paceibacterota bacterium]
MAVTKQKKKEILDKLKDITAKKSVVFISFHKVPVTETTLIRSKLRKEDVSYYVAKKTLIQKAFSESKIAGNLPELNGELALVYGDDLTAPAREIYEFQKKFKGGISILGGVFENKFLTKSEMEEIAMIPGHDILKGMFVNVINSPIQGLVLSLKALADKKSA